jgi:hypothetical protein
MNRILHALMGGGWAVMRSALLAVGLVVAGSSVAQAQSLNGGSLSASVSVVPVGAATDVVFQVAIPPDPKLIGSSVNLQRLNAGKWELVGSMKDDGTDEDTAAGDSVFTITRKISESNLGTISFRATSGYRGSLARANSNTLSLNVTPALALSIDTGATELVVEQGGTVNLVTTVTLTNNGFGTLNVESTVDLTPNDGGLEVQSDYPSGGWFSSTSTSFVLNQEFRGVTVGDYVMTNTVVVDGHPLTAVGSVTVRVVPVGGDPKLLIGSVLPGAIPVAEATEVIFTVTATDFTTAPDTLTLYRQDDGGDVAIGILRDDGVDPDLSAGDAVYSGHASILAAVEGILEFRAGAVFPGIPGERYSPYFGAIVSPFPSTTAAPVSGSEVADPASGGQVYPNEVMICFKTPLPSVEVVAFAAAYGGTVIGTIPEIETYQLRVAAATVPEINDLVARLKADPRVKDAYLVPAGTTSEFTPNDSRYGEQYGPQKVRADEAWVIARGGPVISVIDTGVNYNHVDLAGKVIKGRDFVNGDNDPMDDQGHGTHVAGIAAARGNNGTGVAGIAFNSPILAVKVLNNSQPAGWGSYANISSGIIYAAARGARVINLSLSGVSPSQVLVDALNYAVARGCLVVAAAGNDGINVQRYPGAYADAFCVGSTTSTDARSGFSTYGAHVDIAAPGSSILSTLYTGGYGLKSGTSMATPCVAGAAAVLWSRYPGYTLARVRARLQATGERLPGLLIGNRVDVFEAVFNGSFEDGMNGWSVAGTAGSVTSMGPLGPRHRQRFGFASSGPDNAVVETRIQQSFTIQPGVTSFRISFDYNFVTEEYPEYVGSIFNDRLNISLLTPAGTTVPLAFESVNSSVFSPVGGINFPGGDNTVGQTGWKTATANVPVTLGPGTYRLVVRDEGDGIYDSNALLDSVRFR